MPAPRCDRRSFLGGLAAAAVAGRAGAARPNILFVAIDDLNDWLGCLGGHPQARTPHLDALAARGVLFHNAHCAAPACNPSRTALLTGLRPSTTGVYHNNQPWRPVLRDAVTLGQALQGVGYQVLASGKLFHGGFNDLPSWSRYVDRLGDPQPVGRPLNGITGAAQFDWGPVDAPPEAMGDWQLVDWAVEQLRRPPAEPWFLAVGLVKPHLPWYVPRQYFDRFPLADIILPDSDADDLDDVPAVGRSFVRRRDHENVLRTDNWARAVQGYLATISFVDDCIGRLIDGLDAAGRGGDTIVCLWGDHGWHLGEKLHWRKFSLWEEANRNPLMMIVPGLTAPGGVCRRPVSLLDLHPTLLELAGAPLPEAQEGRSLRPWLADPTAPADRSALCTHGRGNHSLRDERWRYTRYHDGGEELYDHDADPLERRNLAGLAEHREVIESLQRWLPGQDAPDAPRGRGEGE